MTRSVSSVSSRSGRVQRIAIAQLAVADPRRDLRAERDLLLLGRRVVVVEVEAGLPDADHDGRARRAPTRSSHTSSSSEASCGWRPTVARTSGCRAATAIAPGDVSRSVPTQITRPTPAARARSSAASAPPVSTGRWQWLSTQPVARSVDAREERCALVERAPGGQAPPAAASGSRSSVGVAGKPEAAPELGATRAGSAATRAARRCAAPRGSRRAPPRSRPRHPPC